MLTLNILVKSLISMQKLEYSLRFTLQNTFIKKFIDKEM